MTVRAFGPARLSAANAPVTFRICTSSRQSASHHVIHRSSAAVFPVVTVTKNSSSSTRQTAPSSRITPSSFNMTPYRIRPTARSENRFGYSRSSRSTACGPFTRNFPSVLTSMTPTRLRTASTSSSGVE